MILNPFPKIKQMWPERSRLSVIIPTLNEIAYLPGLLAALAAQTDGPDEIIVADAGSTDGTVELAKSWGVKVVQGGLPGIGRNAGARAATGDILLFFDADVLPPRDFIARTLEEFFQEGFDVATCFIAAVDQRPLDQILSAGANLYFRVIQPVSPHAPGFCILSKRSIHEEMGGFDETLTLSEDIDYARRAKRHGKFGMLAGPRIPVSMRRVEKEGLVRLGLKYAWCELYALAGKPVRSAPFKYEYGTFEPPLTAPRKVAINTEAFSLQWKRIGDPVQRIGRDLRDQLGR